MTGDEIKKGQHGGWRPNSGRKTGYMTPEVKKRVEMQKRWLDRIHSEADKVFDAHIAAALGHYAERTLADGETVIVYKKSPNPLALEWIMEHVWGKAPQKVDVDAFVKGELDLTVSPETALALKQAIKYAIPSTRFVEPVGDAGEPEEEPREPSETTKQADTRSGFSETLGAI